MNFALVGTVLLAEPPARRDRAPGVTAPEKKAERDPARARVIESANGWMYLNGEWLHPEGYKFINNKVLRTTLKTGKPLPKPPGKLALQNPTKLTPRARPPASDARTAAEEAAETRRKNLEPRPAPQTGTHL